MGRVEYRAPRSGDLAPFPCVPITFSLIPRWFPRTPSPQIHTSANAPHNTRVRTRAVPRSTPLGKEPDNIHPFFSMRAANLERAASPSIIGTKPGRVPGFMVRPRSVKAARKNFVFSSSSSRSSVDPVKSSIAFIEAATIGGETVLE